MQGKTAVSQGNAQAVNYNVNVSRRLRQQQKEKISGQQ